MATQKELKIPIDDLVSLVLVCKCGSEVCINSKKESIGKEVDPKYFATKFATVGNIKCPVCLVSFNAQREFPLLLDALWNVAETKQRVYFRIKNPDLETSEMFSPSKTSSAFRW
jgi:hypothetical protein